ncbi:hypothetical protein ACFV4T_40820 [Streptomyces sp. NPDC059755]
MSVQDSPTARRMTSAVVAALNPGLAVPGLPGLAEIVERTGHPRR